MTLTKICASRIPPLRLDSGAAASPQPTRRPESEAADIKRCVCLPVAEVGHDCGQIGPRDDVEQLLLVDRKPGPELSQFIDRVDIGNDGVMACSFQSLVVETPA